MKISFPASLITPTMVRLIVVAPAFFEFTNDRLGVSALERLSFGIDPKFMFSHCREEQQRGGDCISEALGTLAT